MSLGEFKLPLRLLGLKNIPAVPVDIGGMVDTLGKLDTRAKQTEQAIQGLTNTYTIDGNTATGHAFLFGGVPADHHAAKARARLHGMLGGNPLEMGKALVDMMKEEGEDVFEDIFDKESDDTDLTALALEAARQFSMSWTNLPEVYHDAEPQLDALAATIDVNQPDKATEAFWPTIAEYGLAYNLILPKKVDTEDLDTWKSLFGDTWTPALDTAAGAGLLYVIDLRIYETIEPQEVDGATRFTPSTVTVMVQDAATKAMTPELIRVAGHEGAGAEIYDRHKATASAWVYALQAAKTSVTVYGIWFGHVYHWHIVTAAMQMTMFDCLDEDHPVRRLMDPQSNYLIPFDDVLLVLWRFIAPPTSVKTGWQFLELSNTFAKGRQFFDDDPTTTLQSLGLEPGDFTVGDEKPWSRYPIVQQLLEIWDATGQYVDVYVDKNYPTDQDVQEDEPLQRWIKDSGKKRDGNVQGLPEMDSKENLKRVLHSLVYRITAHGTGRLYRVANPQLTFVGNFPPCLQDSNIPRSTAEFDNSILLQYLPKTGTIGGMVTFYFTFSFSTPYESFVPIEGIQTNLYLEDPETNAALVALRKFITHFIKEYQPDSPQTFQWPLNIET